MRAENLEHIREVEKRSRSKRNQKVENIEQRKEIKKSGGKVISLINLFHNEIKHGPEYVCTCCDQLWYRSSVLKCDANKYKACSQDVVSSCVTGLRSIDNTEWICTTCDTNLKKGKMPSCSKANKMRNLNC